LAMYMFVCPLNETDNMKNWFNVKTFLVKKLKNIKKVFANRLFKIKIKL